MQPIICPQCQAEVIPHETHNQRLSDCFEMVDAKFKTLSEDNKVKIALSYFAELNDFIISEDIHKHNLELEKIRKENKRGNVDYYNKKKFNEPK